jgi:hypothetical protein
VACKVKAGGTVCGKKFTIKEGRGDGTSNLLAHLKRAHAVEHKKVINASVHSNVTKDKRADDIHKAGGAMANWVKGSSMSASKRKELNRLYVLWTATACRPFDLINSDMGFRLFLSQLDPAYLRETISDDTINRILALECDTVRNGIVNELKEQRDWMCSGGVSTSFLAATVDLTTTANVEYATLSVSFVNKDMELKKIGLCTRPFTGVHTAEACAGWITEVRCIVCMKTLLELPLI